MKLAVKIYGLYRVKIHDENITLIHCGLNFEGENFWFVAGVAVMMWQMFVVKKMSAASFLIEKVRHIVTG